MSHPQIPMDGGDRLFFKDNVQEPEEDTLDPNPFYYNRTEKEASPPWSSNLADFHQNQYFSAQLRSSYPTSIGGVPQLTRSGQQLRPQLNPQRPGGQGVVQQQPYMQDWRMPNGSRVNMNPSSPVRAARPAVNSHFGDPSAMMQPGSGVGAARQLVFPPAQGPYSSSPPGSQTNAMPNYGPSDPDMFPSLHNETDFPSLPGHSSLSLSSSGLLRPDAQMAPYSSSPTSSSLPSSGPPSTSHSGESSLANSTDGTDAKVDPFSLMGLLQLRSQASAAPGSYAAGSDLTSLGLNLSSPDVLYSSFTSPFMDAPSHEPEFQIPSCYYIRPPLASPVDKMSLFSDETLFYIFYSMPGDQLQLAAARELQVREWSYHTELKAWFQRVQGTAPSTKTATYEIGSYHYFDPRDWEKKRKVNFRMEYDKLASKS